MAPVNFQKTVLVLLVACQVIAAAPIQRKPAIGPDESAIPATNLFGDVRAEHHLAKRDTNEAEQSIPSRLREGSMAALRETGKIVQTAVMLPAETLQLVRLLTVPVLDAALSLPANALESAASISSRGLEGAKATARSSTEGILSFLAKVKQFKQSLLPHIGITKELSLGPLSIHKTFEFGTPKKEVTPPPPVEVYTTPHPAIKVPVTEAPKVEVTTPEPLPAPTTVAPSVEPPVPVTTPAPVIVAPVAPVPAVVIPVTPAPAVVVPLPPVTAPVVVVPPVVDSGNQVQVVNVINGGDVKLVPDAPAPVPVVTPAPVLVVPAAPVAPVPAIVAPAAPAPPVVAPAAPSPAVVAPVVVAPPPISDGDQVQVATVVKN